MWDEVQKRTKIDFSFWPTRMWDGELIWFKFYYKHQEGNFEKWCSRNGLTGYHVPYWKTVKRSKTL